MSEQTKHHRSNIGNGCAECDKLKCPGCIDISELEIDYPDEPHHGGIRYCGECDAQYAEEYSGKLWALNNEALINHPELKLI